VVAKLIKNGTLITASETFVADILVEDEKISLIGKDLQHPNAEVVDATGKLIMPGGIDPHTHFDLPMFGTVSSDDHYTGHQSRGVRRDHDRNGFCRARVSLSCWERG